MNPKWYGKEPWVTIILSIVILLIFVTLIIYFSKHKNNVSESAYTSSSPVSVPVSAPVVPTSVPETVSIESNATTTVNSKLENDITSTLKRGVPYTYYGEGGKCDENCLTKEQAHQLCSQITGYTEGMLDSMINSGFMNEKDRVILGNTQPRFSTSWDGSKCKGTVTSDGFYQGSSAHVSVNGDIQSFGISDSGVVLANYIDYRFTY